MTRVRASPLSRDSERASSVKRDLHSVERDLHSWGRGANSNSVARLSSCQLSGLRCQKTAHGAHARRPPPMPGSVLTPKAPGSPSLSPRHRQPGQRGILDRGLRWGGPARPPFWRTLVSPVRVTLQKNRDSGCLSGATGSPYSQYGTL
jgi:hypothetical protein